MLRGLKAQQISCCALISCTLITSEGRGDFSRSHSLSTYGATKSRMITRTVSLEVLLQRIITIIQLIRIVQGKGIRALCWFHYLSTTPLEEINNSLYLGMRRRGHGGTKESQNPDLPLEHSCTLILQPQASRGNQTLQVCQGTHMSYTGSGGKQTIYGVLLRQVTDHILLHHLLHQQRAVQRFDFPHCCCC